MQRADGREPLPTRLLRTLISGVLFHTSRRRDGGGPLV